jgi:formate hydrogenlyase subunit 3/multisubunit Na+/H+ antiporter MnhD subunit
MIEETIEETQEKDYFILYIALTAVVLIGVLLMVKSSENDKFAPIKAQLVEERNLMDIRVTRQDYE